jgi:hypothetical protein
LKAADQDTEYSAAVKPSAEDPFAEIYVFEEPGK